ncbi:pseudouridylate synthase RPUSD4, mitochondrial-like isoform X2 [Ptychodera flava]|uniref:pseudouridylate synthase RPUSD4, mitochondrial-like isoform X2 n=1 Tax=Ptychodera flava TaxID=63121 RepID=UPI00396A19C1
MAAPTANACRALTREMKSKCLHMAKYFRTVTKCHEKHISRRGFHSYDGLFQLSFFKTSSFKSSLKVNSSEHSHRTAWMSCGKCLFCTREIQSTDGVPSDKIQNPDEDFFGLNQEGNFDKFENVGNTMDRDTGGSNRRRRRQRNAVTRLTRVIHNKHIPEADDIVVDSSRKRPQRSLNVAESQDSEISAEKLAKQIRKRIQEGKPKITQNTVTDDATDNVDVSSIGRIDSQGFRVLSHQTQDLSKLSPYVVAKILKDCVIYDHGGPGIKNNVNDTLQLLAKLIDKNLQKLHLVHRLDKETTGVMLLAKSEITARQLNSLFRHHQVVKKYWVLTIRIPEPSEGVVDIPMAEGEVVGKKRMVLRPDFSLEYKDLSNLPSGKGVKAITNYRVLANEGNCALVELQPETGIKHQIRCHLAVGLGCPILGDHKYSHNDRLAPQKIPGDMLQKLGMRQSKARTIPMHLHAKQLIIPQFRDGRNLFISAGLPSHFVKNMRRLNIRV